jgi:hypothetical protein
MYLTSSCPLPSTISWPSINEVTESIQRYGTVITETLEHTRAAVLDDIARLAHNAPA